MTLISTLPEETAVLQRLAQLELAIQSGFNDLNQKLANALLEQERRNSTFATRDRLDELSRKVDGVTQGITTLGQRADVAHEDDKALRARMVEIESKVSSRTIEGLKALTGLLASAMAMILTAIVTFVLTHGVH